MVEISYQRCQELLQEGQARVLEQLYRNCPLEEICCGIVASIEKMGDGIFCSVLRYNPKTETLHKLAAPSLPDFYNAAIDGMKIGDGVGACGAAAFHKRRIVTADILQHPYWKKARNLVKKTQLRSCWSQPILDHDGNMLGTFAIYYDEPCEPGAFEVDLIVSAARLTALAIHHRQAEEQRKKLENQLYQTHKMEAIGTLAGGIAHDFNNLLAIISANIEMIQRRIDGNQNPEKYILNSKEAVLRATALVKKILSFSRQEKHELAPTRLSDALEESLRLLRSTIPATVEIQTIHDDKSIVIDADNVQLQQVIVNLCTNAVHAMDDSGLLSIGLQKVSSGKLDIPPGVKSSPAGFAKLMVADSGNGMDQETMDRIFDPFFTTKEVGLGTGMGLPMVHGIVEQHGGFITVNSEPGQGAAFNIYIPLLENQTAVPADAPPKSFPVGSEQILLVDDEVLIVSATTELLELQGYRVTGTSSSRAALEIFKNNPEKFDLVITDQTMPELTGDKLAAKLLAITPDIPIILCSGHSSIITEAEALQRGIRAFCMKPLDSGALFTSIRKVLDG